MRAVTEADGAACARDLFHHHDMREISEIAAAEALRHRNAEQSLLTEFRPQCTRELVGAVDLVCERGNLGCGEPPHATPDFIQRLTEAEIKFPLVRIDHGLPAFWS